MSAPIFSPDGEFMWTGADWIPAPPSSKNEASTPETTNIAPGLHQQDSVMSGDINTNQSNFVQTNKSVYSGGNQHTTINYNSDPAILGILEKILDKGTQSPVNSNLESMEGESQKSTWQFNSISASTDWRPSEELVAWGNEHFGKMPVDSVWSPDDSGVQYRKMSETNYALIFMLNHPLAQEHHEKFTLLMKACGYTVEKPDGLVMETPPIDPAAQAEMNFRKKQELAQSWTCECGFHLSSNDFSKALYEYVETIDSQNSDGGAVPIDLWRVVMACGGCGKHLTVDPNDFHLLAGDDEFMRWRHGNQQYIALTREQLKNYADEGWFDAGYSNTHITVLGKFRNGVRVPPWLWGITCFIQNE